jgi:Domain of unknown function (DUF4386)
MQRLSLTTVGAWCGILTTACFAVGIGFMAGSGVQVLIPDSGKSVEWIADVSDAGDLFFAGAWLIVLGGLVGLLALVGFYNALRDAGPVLVLAPIAAAVGLSLVTISHLIPIAMAYELVPGYTDGDAATKASLLVTADTLGMLSLVTNHMGDLLLWGFAIPLYAWAILTTRVIPRWIGWLGIVVAVFAGWLSLLGPLWSVFEGLSVIGFLGFFLFMASMGVALLRRKATV